MIFKSDKLRIASYTLCLLFFSNAASAILAVDQTGSTIVTGGYSGTVVQSFTPGQNNIAGVDAHYYAFGGTTNISLNVWGVGAWTGTDFNGSPLHTEILNGVTACASGDIMCTEFRWEEAPVPILPGELYYLEFVTSAGAIGTSTVADYPGGQTLAGGGNLFGGAADLAFRTYFAPVPLPAAFWLFISAITFLGRRRLGAG